MPRCTLFYWIRAITQSKHPSDSITTHPVVLASLTLLLVAAMGIGGGMVREILDRVGCRAPFFTYHAAYLTPAFVVKG